MSSVAEIWNMSDAEATEISCKLATLAVKHQDDEDVVAGMVLDILQEKDTRLREIMLFSLGLSLGE